MSTVYQWREGYSLNANPDAVGQEVERLAVNAQGGLITPQIMVAAARNPASALHDLFEWDDAEAARQQRLDFARHILKALVVTVRLGPKTAVTPLRAVVTVAKSSQRAGEALRGAAAEKRFRDSVLAQAWEDLISWKRRYGEYPELAVAVAALNVALRRRDEKMAQDKAA